jgi:hypothetical protein
MIYTFMRGYPAPGDDTACGRDGTGNNTGGHCGSGKNNRVLELAQLIEAE